MEPDLRNRRTANRTHLLDLSKLLGVSLNTMYRFAREHCGHYPSRAEIIEAWVRVKTPARLRRLNLRTKQDLVDALSDGKLAPFEAVLWSIAPDKRLGAPVAMIKNRPMTVREIATYLKHAHDALPTAGPHLPPLQRYIDATYSRLALGWTGDRLLTPLYGVRHRTTDGALLRSALEYERCTNPPPIPKLLRASYTRVLRKHAAKIVQATLQRAKEELPKDISLAEFTDCVVSIHGWPPSAREAHRYGLKWSPIGLRGPLWRAAFA